MVQDHLWSPSRHQRVLYVEPDVRILIRPVFLYRVGFDAAAYHSLRIRSDLQETKSLPYQIN